MTDPRPEVPAGWTGLTGGAATFELPEAGALCVRGPDRGDFLNGQVSQDVRRLEHDAARRVLLLDAKGHAQLEATVLPRGDALLVLVEDGALGALQAHLEAHVVFDQVELAPEGRHGGSLTVQGPRAAAVAASAFGAPAPPAEGRFLSVWDDRAILVGRDRSGRGGVDVHLLGMDAGEARAALHAAGAEDGTAVALEAARIAAGVPRVGREARAGALPQAAGLEALVNYRKGCYLGQEIMARLEARGTLKRHLVGLRLAGDPGAEAGAPVRHQGRAVGHLGGWAPHPELGPVALAVVRDDVPDDATLEVAATTARRASLPLRGAATLAP